MSRFIAIDIDPQGLFVAAGSARGGAAKVEHALAWIDGTAPALSADTAKVIGEQLRERLKAAGVAPAPVLVGVGRDKVILKELRYPAVPPAQEPALVKFQAMKELTESPDEVVIDYAPLANGVANPEAERRSMAVALRKDVFAAIQAVCAAAGLKLAGVTPRPFAVAAGIVRAFAAGAVQPPDSAEDAIAVLTAGPNGGEFTVLRHAQVSFTRAVPAPVVASESQLVNEVRRNLALYAGQNPTHPVQAVYVAEAESGAVGWAGRLRAALSVPVHAYDPLAGSEAAVAAQVRGRFAGAVGLLAGKAADALPINFASPRQPRAEKDPKKRQLIFAGGLAAAVLLAGGILGLMAVSAADDRLAAARADKDRLEGLRKKLEPDGKRLAAVDQWVGREVVVLDQLFDISDRFPKDDSARVNSFDLKAMPITKDGKQKAQAALTMMVGTKTPESVNRVQSEFEKDNTEKTRFYTNTQLQTRGTVGTGPYAQTFQLTTEVHRRPPDKYTRFPTFITPSRRTTNGGTLPSTPQPEEKTEADPPVVEEP